MQSLMAIFQVPGDRTARISVTVVPDFTQQSCLHARSSG